MSSARISAFDPKIGAIFLLSSEIVACWALVSCISFRMLASTERNQIVGHVEFISNTSLSCFSASGFLPVTNRYAVDSGRICKKIIFTSFTNNVYLIDLNQCKIRLILRNMRKLPPPLPTGFKQAIFSIHDLRCRKPISQVLAVKT